jgi:hypothetical protein
MLGLPKFTAETQRAPTFRRETTHPYLVHFHAHQRNNPGHHQRRNLRSSGVGAGVIRVSLPKVPVSGVVVPKNSIRARFQYRSTIEAFGLTVDIGWTFSSPVEW